MHIRRALAVHMLADRMLAVHSRAVMGIQTGVLLPVAEGVVSNPAVVAEQQGQSRQEVGVESNLLGTSPAGDLQNKIKNHRVEKKVAV